MRNYKELKVWEKAHSVTLDVYHLTSKFPKQEQFGLTSQMRRAAVSVASNIVEGSARKTDKEFIQFLYIALGSANELDYQLFLAKDLTFITEEIYLDADKNINEVKRMLNSFISHLSNAKNN
ncbi:MAG: four helix bundle protein [Bacteroidetes bacterium]|nr:four helix bundle protein [Bacteroidota bacterium]